ncbi:uncharacterized protein LOC110862192 [Folsomia candida]|uniref:Sorting nexin-3 n=1 Tax=Folsomia candida TaxID=158441 RepID=A0A226CX83_FOLCA|nr:uncharacterized protein LOC110862192 [Folsomia candida]OXA37932.1 Sorting nexin-3 [Folsomia candida]
MGVLPRFYQQDNEEEVTSEFSDLSLTSQRDEYDEDDYGVTVYNLAECEFPVGLDFEGGSSGYFAIMDMGEPVTITAKQSRFAASTFTTYLVRVESNFPTLSHKFCTVRRRYTEFCWLRDELVKNNRNRQVPKLPSKKLIPFTNFNASFIQERLTGLSHFLQRVLENPTFLRDPALLFFLQSDRTVQEMLDMRKSSSIRISSCAVQITSSTGSDTVSPLLRSEDDESSSQGDDEEEENVDLTLNPVAKPSILSTSPSESSDLGKFGLLRDVGKAQPIPVPYRKNNKKIEDSDRLSTSSSEGDSGHFEASSSASTSPSTATTGVRDANKISQIWARHQKQNRHQNHHRYLEEDEYNTASQPPSLLQVNEFLLYNPTCYYVMQ